MACQECNRVPGEPCCYDGGCVRPTPPALVNWAEVRHLLLVWIIVGALAFVAVWIAERVPA